MDKYKEASELLSQAAKLFDGSDHSTDIFLRNSILRVNERVQQRIKNIKDAQMLNEPPKGGTPNTEANGTPKAEAVEEPPKGGTPNTNGAPASGPAKEKKRGHGNKAA